MQKLSELPNIGSTLEKKLKQAAILSSTDLINIGAEQAFLRLSGIDENSCFNMLCALEGAVQGIRWHKLSKERKAELKEFLNLKRQS